MIAYSMSRICAFRVQHAGRRGIERPTAPHACTTHVLLSR
jgi:hypothetical protein